MLAIASLAVIAAMPAWRWVLWAPALLPEAYHITTEEFLSKVNNMNVTHSTGELTEDGLPLIHPPPGDIYLTAQRFRFTPMLELEVGRTYRLHVATTDGTHGFTFPLADINTLLVQGQAVVIPLVPTQCGHYTIQCSEYCGLGHDRMKGWVRVIDSSGKH